MPHILLTNRCNLGCSYCFANEFVNKDNCDITVEDYNKAVDFILQSGVGFIGLIGGEPLLHPDFGLFVDTLKKNPQIQKITIFTNGLLINDYIDKIIDPQVHLLINCNTKEILKTKENYKKLISNIELIHKETKNKDNIHLGINIYSAALDYDWVFKLLKKYKKRELRISISVPNYICSNIPDFETEIIQYKPFLFKLYKKLSQIGVLPLIDCNVIPNCMYTDSEKKMIEKLFKKFPNSFHKERILGQNVQCLPTVDILPNLEAIRCFGLSGLSKVNIQNYENIQEIKKHFIDTIDIPLSKIQNTKYCSTCLQSCNICFCYKKSNQN